MIYIDLYYCVRDLQKCWTPWLYAPLGMLLYLTYVQAAVADLSGGTAQVYDYKLHLILAT